MYDGLDNSFKKKKKQTNKKKFQSPENISGQIIKAYEILPTKLF